MRANYPGVVKEGLKRWFGNVRVTKADPITAFFMKVEITDSCWLWKGNTSKWGYGVITRKGKAERAHRWLYETFYGPLSEDEICCHKCDVRNCVNPAHIFIGTRADNQKDMANKNRSASGSGHGMAKLTWEDVRKIRSLYDEVGPTELGKMFNVHYSHIWLIKQNRIWKERV